MRTGGPGTRSLVGSPKRGPARGGETARATGDGTTLVWATILGAAMVVAVTSPSLAQGSARQADEDACRPDVFRLCASAIPDEASIVRCLERQVRDLSPACRGVIAPEARAPARSR